MDCFQLEEHAEPPDEHLGKLDVALQFVAFRGFEAYGLHTALDGGQQLFVAVVDQEDEGLRQGLFEGFEQFVGGFAFHARRAPHHHHAPSALVGFHVEHLDEVGGVAFADDGGLHIAREAVVEVVEGAEAVGVEHEVEEVLHVVVGADAVGAVGGIGDDEVQVGVHQRGNLLAAGALAAGVGAERPLAVVHTVLAAEVLHVGPGHLQAAVRLAAKDELGMAHAAAVDDRRQPIDDILLSDNVFKLHTRSH